MGKISGDFGGKFKRKDLARVLAEARRQRADGRPYKGMDGRNIDPSKSDLNLHFYSATHKKYKGDPWAAAINLHHGRKKLDDSNVITRGIVLQASPEYFYPEMKSWTQEEKEDPRLYSKRGPLDQEATQAFWKYSLAWLQKKYGDTLFEVHLHLDEASPHIHAHVLPYDQERHCFSSKTWITGKVACRAWHTELAREVGKPLGLERATEGAPRDPNRPHYSPPQEIIRMLELKEEAGRERQQEALAHIEKDPNAAAWAWSNEKLKTTKAERQAKQAEARAMELEELRGIPLASVLAAWGLEKDVENFWRGDGDRKIALEKKTGPLFIDNHDQEFKGAGAIDLAGCLLHGHKPTSRAEIASAIAWLKENFGAEATSRAWAAEKMEKIAKEQTQKLASEAKPILPPKGNQTALETALAEAQERKCANSLKSLLESKQLFIDQQANLVIPCNHLWKPEPSGYLKRGTWKLKGRKNSFKQSIGTSEASAPCLKGPQAPANPRPEQIALVEGVWDAIALLEIDPSLTTYITNGNQHLYPPDGIKPGILAFDADESGKKHAARYKADFTEAKEIRPPEGKDWSEFLTEYWTAIEIMKKKKREELAIEKVIQLLMKFLKHIFGLFFGQKPTNKELAKEASAFFEKEFAEPDTTPKESQEEEESGYRPRPC